MSHEEIQEDMRLVLIAITSTPLWSNVSHKKSSGKEEHVLLLMSQTLMIALQSTCGLLNLVHICLN
jgi:hypothetical protein